MLAALPIACAAAPPSENPAADETAGSELLDLLLERRREAGVATAQPPGLGRVAEWLAAHIEARGEVAGDVFADETLRRAAVGEGYVAQRMAVGFAQGNSGVDSILASWRQADPATYAGFLDPEMGDLAVASGTLRGGPFFVVLTARSAAAHHAVFAAELADLEAVRRQLLDAVNAERLAAGVSRLGRHHALDTAAQRYAEAMLAGGFYGHVAPDGTNVLHRALAAGYPGRRVGENLASGAESVERVMGGWLNSPAHHENIISTRFTDAGFGVAFGESEEGFQYLWVQLFGRRR